MSTEDDVIFSELVQLAEEREALDLAEAKRRIAEREATEQAEADRQAAEQRRAAEHVAAVLRAHACLADLGHIAVDIDTALVTLTDALVRYQAALPAVQSALSAARRDGAALEQQLGVRLLSNVRDQFSQYGLPPSLRALFPGRLEGSVTGPLFDLIDVVLRDVFSDLTLIRPSEVVQP